MKETPLVFELFGHHTLATAIAQTSGAEPGRLLVRRFPDEESYLRYETPVEGRDVWLVANLARPDPRIPALLYAGATAKELGARSVSLLAPYLPYMRQDHRFASGEAVTSRIFARLLCSHFDRLVTVDPHLHRHARLEEIYAMPAQHVSAAQPIAEWLRANVNDPVVLGPDSESEQWVASVAQLIGAPWQVSSKVRNGDRDVSVHMSDLASWRARTPVLLDDIISSGRTMIEAARQVLAAGLRAPVCIGVHAVFADGALEDVRALASRVVTTDTLPHATNAISVAAPLARAIARPPAPR
jgi:ribose-phosphate pyrophosphokinase